MNILNSVYDNKIVVTRPLIAYSVTHTYHCSSFVVNLHLLITLCLFIFFFLGLESTDILEKAFPRYGQLSKGVSYIYDIDAHVHAYKFTNNVAHVTLHSSEVLKQCKFFPNEFSVFFIIKHSRTYTGKECVLVIGDFNTNILTIEITQRYIIFKYKLQKVKFKNIFISDNKWHTLGLSVGGTHVTMTTDCINKKHRRLKRMFPDTIDAVNKTITIGSCDQQKGVFQVSLRVFYVS